MGQISLQTGIIYGPVFSRRLGRSFGINLLPRGYKCCSFNCIYCQYGLTNRVTCSPEENEFPRADTVFAAVERALLKPRSIDALTFSGNGEPTLHPKFLEIAQGVMEIRDRLRPGVELALLSNAFRVSDIEVQKAVELIDRPMMKLDAGDEKTFQSINQPADNIDLSEIINGLKEISGLTIQSAMIDGPVSNIRGRPFEKWLEILAEIHPREVHIYTTERPTALENVKRVTETKLQEIETILINDYGLDAHAFWSES